jgi:hypothetical protein
MEIRSRRVESFLYAQRLAACELRDKLGFDDQFVGAALEYGELVGDVGVHTSAASATMRTARGCRAIERPEFY